jgi:type II secretory pathway pseudopilin PulG
MRRQSGFSVLTLLIVAATLLAGFAFVLIGGGPNVQGQLNAQRASQLVAQAQLMVHRITKCATDYPAGDNGTIYHKAYPKDGNTGAAPVALAASALVCPGNNQNLWSGVDGVYPPAPIADFGAWTYTNANPAVITITTNKPDLYNAAIAQAVSKMGASVASATTSSVAGDTLTVKVIE